MNLNRIVRLRSDKYSSFAARSRIGSGVEKNLRKKKRNSSSNNDWLFLFSSFYLTVSIYMVVYLLMLSCWPGMLREPGSFDSY